MRTMANELSNYHKECEDLKMDVQRYKGELNASKQEYFARRKNGTLSINDGNMQTVHEGASEGA